MFICVLQQVLTQIIVWMLKGWLVTALFSLKNTAGETDKHYVIGGGCVIPYKDEQT